MCYTKVLSADALCNLLCSDEQAHLTSGVLIVGLFMEDMQTPFECLAESSLL